MEDTRAGRQQTSLKVLWKDLFRTYLRDTSLHGLKYIGQPRRHVLERLFWALAFLSGIFAGLYLITDIFNKYNTNPVIVSFQAFETQINELPFPALTICNMNKVLRSRAEQYISDLEETERNSSSSKRRKNAIKNMFYLDHVCSSTKSFSKIFNFSLDYGFVQVPTNFDFADVDHSIRPDDVSSSSSSSASLPLSPMEMMAVAVDVFGERADVKEFLSHASQPCANMLKLCVWHEEVVSCTDIFRPIETDFGKCCTFNMVPPTLLDTLKNDTRDDPTEVHEWAKWNVNQKGLILTDEDFDLVFPRRQIRAGKSYGLSFLLDPNMQEYFCTTSDSTGFRMVAHLPIEFPQVVDYGIAIQPNAEIFIGVRPEIVVSDPIISGFPKEKRECYFPNEFTLQYYNYYTASNCIDECVANETYKVCNCVTYYMPRDNSRQLCGPSNFGCTRKVKKSFSATGKKALCKQCIPACTDVRYLLEVTATPLQTDHPIWVDSKKANASWMGHNVSIVHIFFSQDSTYARLRKQLYGLTDLIANTGGLMGLCLGFSGLSLAEIGYFILLAMLIAWRQRRCQKVVDSPSFPATEFVTSNNPAMGNEDKSRIVWRRNPDLIMDHSALFHDDDPYGSNPAVIFERRFLSRFGRSKQGNNKTSREDDTSSGKAVQEAWTSRILNPALHRQRQRQRQRQNSKQNQGDHVNANTVKSNHHHHHHHQFGSGESLSTLRKSSSVDSLKKLQMRTDVLSGNFSSYYSDNAYWNFNE